MVCKVDWIRGGMDQGRTAFSIFVEQEAFMTLRAPETATHVTI